MRAEPVIITIQSRFFGEEEDDSELLVYGKMYAAREAFYVMYEQVDEDGMESRSLLKITDYALTMIRHGTIKNQMIFMPETVTEGLIETPVGLLPMEIATSAYELAVGEAGLEVRVLYRLLSEGEHVSNCNITILIQYAKRMSESFPV